METPHPSIQTQDQIFKLPSSQPQYSPNLSPVPVPTTRSRNLKENRVSTPWTELTSKTLSSGGLRRSPSSNSSSSAKSRHPTKKSLKANMKPRSSKPRNSKSGSNINIARALASPFVSRASSPIDDQNDLSSQKPRPRTSTATNRGKRGLSNTFYNPNLPSPQTHEREKAKGSNYSAQSAHTSPSSKPPLLLDLNTQLKQKRRKGAHRGTVSVDDTRATEVDLQEGGGKTKKKQGGQQRERRPSAPSSYSLRPRPLKSLVCAPAGSQGTKARKSRLASGLEIIHNNNNVTSTEASASVTAAAINHTDDDGFVLPLLPHSHNKNPTTITSATSAALDVDMDWRVGIVDFNRPPSQLCHYPTTTMLDGWASGNVFSSSSGSSSSESEDDADDNEIEVNPSRLSRARTRTARPLTSGSTFDDPFGFGFGFGSMLPLDLNMNVDLDLDQSRFGDGAWGISTPLKMQIQRDGKTHNKEGKEKKKEKRMIVKATSISDLRSKNGGLVKMRSLPVMGSVGRGMEMEHDDVDVNEEADNEEQEQDMDLTTPLITAIADMGTASAALGATEVMQLEDGRGDMTPWIMDSLISPPSRFLDAQGAVGKGYTSLEDGNEEQDGGLSSSKTLSSCSSSERNFLSSPFQLSSEVHTQPQPQPEATPSVVTAAAPITVTAATSFTAKRTRSGTIVPSSHRTPNNITNINTNDPPGTRRTRSGTLVGPLPLAASGGVQLVVGTENPSVVRRGRERSGTILAGPSPLPVSVGMGRTRSGTVIGRAPPIPVPAPVSPLVSGSGSGSGGILTKRTRSGPEIEEDMSTTSNSKSGALDRVDEHRLDRDNNLTDGNGFTNTNTDVDADDMDVEPHIDALYIPRQSSSPDPIDFLRLAHFQDFDGMREKYQHRSEFGLGIEDREDEDPDVGDDVMAWCVADEPPSPVALRNESKLGRRYSRGGILSIGRRGRGVRGHGREKGKGRTRFMIDGHEEQPDEIAVEREEGEDSDDELLLEDGSTLDIWE